ncbi:MAG: group 1 truncated hemoglobin [Flavipsychrobacter sp.]
MKKTIMKKAALSTVVAGLVISVSMFTSSCKKSSSSPSMTLYDSLGGTSMVADPINPSTQIEKGRLGIRNVVDSTIFVIAGDTAINGYFTVLLSEVTSGNLSGYEALSKNLTDFMCVAVGAKDYTYMGKSMVAAHDPAQNSRINGKVDNGDFDAFVADLVVGAKKNGLSDQLIGRVGAVVNTVRSQVVQK